LWCPSGVVPAKLSSPLSRTATGNVERWCALHPKHRAVRDWLVFEGYRSSLCRLVGHSLVEDEGVCLFDPTPTRTVNRYREEMTEEEYVLVLAARQLVHVDNRI
jgi:hypothetical protein